MKFWNEMNWNGRSENHLNTTIQQKCSVSNGSSIIAEIFLMLLCKFRWASPFCYAIATDQRNEKNETTHLINLRSIANKTVEEVVAIMKKKRKNVRQAAEKWPMPYPLLSSSYVPPQITSVPSSSMNI